MKKTSVVISVLLSLIVTNSHPIYAASFELKKVDLRSFFHGEPAPIPKAPPPKQLAVVSTASGVAVDAQIETFMRAFAAALMAREGKPMLPMLAEKYTIDDIPSGFDPRRLFLQAVDRTPGPTDIVIKSIVVQESTRTAHVEMRYNPEKIAQKNFRFDADGKLLWTDLIRLQVQGWGS